MANQLYEKGAIMLDDQLLVEVTSFSPETDPALQPVKTLQKSFGGVSHGGTTVKCEISSAIPRAGVEYDYLERLQGVTEVTLVVLAHGKSKTSKGYLSNMKETYGVDQNSAISCSFIGTEWDVQTF